MRGIWIAALSLACSAPVETTEPERESEQRRESVEVDAGGPEVAPYLCFRIDDEAGVTDYLPTLRPTLSVVAHRWGWPILIDDDCASVVTVGDVDRGGGASHQSWLPSDTEVALSAAHVGGRSVITLDREFLESGQVVDDDSCLPGERAYLLAHLLTHEIGHALRVPHSDDEGSPMFESARKCWDAPPSDLDLSLSQSRRTP